MKTSDLRKIIQEEIQEVLNSPSDFLKKKFPDVIEYSNDKVGPNINWTVVTKNIWKYNNAENFQEAAGYHPMGYGGPYDFRMLKIEGDKFIYGWHCAASSN